MSPQELREFIVTKWQTLMTIVLVFIVFGLMVSVVQPKKYKSEQRFLVVQQLSADVDPYAATRSTEYITNLFSKVMYSQDFLDKVIASSTQLNPDMFPTEPKDRAKEWKKTLNTSVVGDSGILEVAIYWPDRFQAREISFAIANVLKNSHQNYHSRGDAIQIKTIDAPVTSILPDQPNVPLNLAAGLVLGIIFGLAFIYLFPEREVNFGINRRPKLNPIREHDWSKPMAIPSSRVVEEDYKITPTSLRATSSFMYEQSEIKKPMGQ